MRRVRNGREAGILRSQEKQSLDEISEKDRAFLWAYGLMMVKDFFEVIQGWGDEISYPRGDKEK